ncbi:MAG: hypothetical protein U0637_04145 [Phycisphaerales bacterium]
MSRTPFTLVLLAGAALTSTAHGQIASWLNPAGGNSDVAANWSALPVAGSAVLFGPAGNYAVNWVGTSPVTSSRIDVSANAGVTLSYASPHTITNNIRLGTTGTGTATCTLTTGAVTTGNLVVGQTAGAGGVLNINDADASLVVTNVSALANIGFSGPGSVVISNGGSMTYGADLRVGPEQGVLSVSGVHAGTLSRSRLTPQGFAGLVVSSSTSATMTVADGAVVAASTSIVVGRGNATGTNSITVGGSSSGLDATLTANQDLTIADFATFPGTGFVTLNAGGVITVGNATQVGDFSGSLGTLSVNGGSFTTRSLSAFPGTGTINHTGGAITVSAGAYSPNLVGGVFRVGGTGAGGSSFTLSSNAQWDAPSAGGGDIVCGAAGPGASLILASGADIHQLGGGITVGGGAGVRGILSLADSSTITASGPFTLGGTGSSVLVDTGADMTVAGASLGVAAGDSTSLTVSGAGSTLTVSGRMLAGTDGAGSGGGAAVVLGSGAVLSSTFANPSGSSVRFGLVGGAGGSLSITNATLNAVDDVEYFNGSMPLTMVGGTINATKLDLTNASMSASGLVNADVVSLSGITTITATGNLTLGRPSSTGGVSLGGQMIVGPHTVTLRDADPAVPGSITLSGGTVVAANGISLGARNLGGFGTVNAGITAAAGFSPTGTGLVMLGSVSTVNTITTGTKMTFASGSSYSGNWGFDCDLSVLGGSTFTPGASISMGRASSATGVEFDGVLNVGAHTITCRDADGPRFGGVVNLGGGGVVSANPVRFQGGLLPTLAGNGTIGADCTMSGRIEPGVASGDRTGRIDFTTLTFGAGGSLVIDIEGEGPGQFDSITTVDDLDLNNATLIVNRVGNFFPAGGSTFRIASGGSLFGSTFGTVIAPGFHAVYGVGTVDLVFDGLCDTLDFNQDELFPDTADIDDFLSVFSGGACGTGACGDLDFNNDGLFPDTTDIDALLSVFSGGPCF